MSRNSHFWANSYKNPTIKSIFGFRQIPSGCDDVKSRLINQMNEWDNDNCPQTSEQCPAMPCGQKCLYKVGIYFVKSLAFLKELMQFGLAVFFWIETKIFRGKQTDNKFLELKRANNPYLKLLLISSYSERKIQKGYCVHKANKD